MTVMDLQHLRSFVAVAEEGPGPRIGCSPVSRPSAPRSRRWRRNWAWPCSNAGHAAW